jgi:hypothetical protein
MTASPVVVSTVNGIGVALPYYGVRTVGTDKNLRLAFIAESAFKSCLSDKEVRPPQCAAFQLFALTLFIATTPGVDRRRRWPLVLGVLFTVDFGRTCHDTTPLRIHRARI